jgi:AcrR family transcriptional regulator
VAEKAGVSIGSLYQYFPNKTAILFRLQSGLAPTWGASGIAEITEVV